LPKLPAGVVGVIRWHQNSRDLGFTVTNVRGSGDAYSVDVTTGKLERWTYSETAVKTDAFPEAEIVKWKSFDGKKCQVSLSAARREIFGEAAGACRDSRWTGGPITACVFGRAITI